MTARPDPGVEGALDSGLRAAIQPTIYARFGNIPPRCLWPLQLFLRSGGARQRPFHKQNPFCGFAGTTTYSGNRILHTQLPVAKFDEFSVNGIL
jgi:hypothetical protein